MTKSAVLFFLPATLLTVCLVAASGQAGLKMAFATGNSVSRVESRIQNAIAPVADEERARIRDIEVFGKRSGIAFTSFGLYRTDDFGESWREVALLRESDERISSVWFVDEARGYAIVVDQRNLSVWLERTNDGGATWARNSISLEPADLADGDVAEISISHGGGESGKLESLRLKLTSSSNFDRFVRYETNDDGYSWDRGQTIEQPGRTPAADDLRDDFARLAKTRSDFLRGEKEIPRSEAIIGRHGFAEHPMSHEHSAWYLTQSGKCESFKANCWQSTKIYLDIQDKEDDVRVLSVKEITPPQIKEFTRLNQERAKMAAANSVFALSPGGTTRVSLQRGFDKCTAATSAQMQTWWDSSWFYDVNIYMSGRNRACSQPQLTASWVNTVTQQGWGLIPTVVGYQSPCSVSTSSVKHSSDPVVAEQQGRGEADIAVNDAINLGLTAGSVLYYDMERYDDLSGTGACSTPTKAFLKGWTDRVHELGYQSGVYGSPTNAVGDWLSIPEQSRMDAVWLARWDNVMSVWTYNSPSPVVPDTAWGNHQRIKQWQAPHNETWGGVTFNIDGNIADGPVASALIAKNKRADYDGDGKSDVSVWRPSTGVWYVSHSATPTYLIQTFGIPTDTITPGDYDGDGKTDLAVWRASDGVWHVYSRSIYSASQFGVAGDIPVAADYDGDGRTDIAVWRPSTGVWYIKNSFDSRGTSYTIQTFGLSGDIPVPDDFDGDGKADIAVYRPSDGVWYLLKSTEGFAAIQFGLNGDYPAQADYDGDGRSDLGIFRPSTGVWYLYRSQDGITSLQFGLTGDVPSVGDFDGDGKYDVAVFRPGTGIWYLNRSSAGFSAGQFGLNGDRPVESGYLPPN